MLPHSDFFSYLTIYGYAASIIQGLLKRHEFLACDWSIFSYLKPFIPKLDLSCSDIKDPLIQLCKNYQLACMVESQTFKKLSVSVQRQPYMTNMEPVNPKSFAHES